MDNTALIVIIVLALAAIAVAAWVFMQKRRTEQLCEQFGPEYERAMDEYKDRNRAESVLEEREKRVEALNIHPLSPEECERFTQAWRSVQSRSWMSRLRLSRTPTGSSMK
jgi:Tfp pilus assembly protein PilX